MGYTEGLAARLDLVEFTGVIDLISADPVRES